MTVTLSWWLLPLAVTLICLVWVVSNPAQHSGDYGFDLMPLFRINLAVIVSLTAWLIWALVR